MYPGLQSDFRLQHANSTLVRLRAVGVWLRQDGFFLAPLQVEGITELCRLVQKRAPFSRRCVVMIGKIFCHPDFAV